MNKMSDVVELSAFEIVGSALCVASDDGQKVHDRIAIALRDERRVNLSFLNVKSITSAFLNAAIGQLYGEFPEDKIRANLHVSNAAPEDLALVKRVVDTAKVYFKSPEKFEAVVR